MAGRVMSSDRRIYQRIGSDVDVSFCFFAEDDIIRKGKCVDVSAQGICFITEHKLPMYKKIQLWLEVEQEREALHAEGDIIWKEEAEPGVFRVGVSFDSVNLVEMGRLL